MVAVLRRPARDRDTVADAAVQKPPKPSKEAATDDSFATAKHYICTALGVVMGVQAPSGALSGRTQIAATLAVATYNVCCWETVLLDAPAPGASVVGTQRV